MNKMKILIYCVLATLAVAGIQAGYTCGGNFATDMLIEGQFFGDNVTCVWYIVGNNSQVAILFSGLNLDANLYNLTVLGGNDINSPVIANVTQFQGSVQVVSHFNITKIVFSRKSPSTKNATFSANTTSDCIQTISKSSGLIKSPIYLPNNGTITCTYQVTMETLGNVFVLSFSSFSVPSGNLSIQFGQQPTKYFNDFPQVLVGSKDDNLTMTLNLLMSPSTQYFAAVFASANDSCSGTFTAGDTPTNITLPTANVYPVTCYAQFTTMNKSRQLLVSDNGRPSQPSSVDSIVFYDGLMLTAPIAGNIEKGLRTFVSSGENLRMVANLGIGTRSDTIMVKQDSFSQLVDLTNGPVTRSFNGTLVKNSYVQLQFSSVLDNQKIVIELASNTILTSAIVTVTCSMNAPMVTFNNDSVLFPVVIPTNRAIVTITNLNANQSVTIKATAINDSDCNQLYTEDSGSFAVSANTTECTIAIVTAKPITLELMSVDLCANSYLDIYEGFSKTSCSRTATLNKSYSYIPQINFNGTMFSGTRLLWQSKNTTCLTNLTGRYFVQGSSDNWCGNLGQGTITTPHFPNQYPLNVHSTCPIHCSSNKTVLAYFAFQSVQMLNGHNVTIQSNKTVILLNNSSLPQPHDMILESANLSVTFNSLAKGLDLEQTGQGVQMNYMFLECGQFTKASNGTLMSPANQSAICIWIINTLPNDNDTVYIVNASFTFNNVNTNISKFLTIHDGGSFRDQPISPNNTILSTTNLLWVKYTCTIISNVTDCAGLTIKYTTYNCTMLCKNRMCMKPGWRCDGILQCTDGSDEFNCPIPQPSTTPVPAPPSPPSKGIAGYWIFLCLMFGLILGIVLTVFAPRCIHAVRGRGGHRSNYGTLSEDA